MKKIFILLSLISSTLLFGQQYEHSQKIIESYGQEWYDTQLSTNPGIILLMDKYIDHGFMVKKVSPGKYSQFAPLTEIPLRSKTDEKISIEQFIEESKSPDFNPLRYNFFTGKIDQIFPLSGHDDTILYIYNQNTILVK